MKGRFDESFKFTEDSLHEKLHIFRDLPFNRTQAKNIIKKSISKTFHRVFEKHQIQDPCILCRKSEACDSGETQY